MEAPREGKGTPATPKGPKKETKVPPKNQATQLDTIVTIYTDTYINIYIDIDPHI